MTAPEPGQLSVPAPEVIDWSMVETIPASTFALAGKLVDDIKDIIFDEDHDEVLQFGVACDLWDCLTAWMLMAGRPVAEMRGGVIGSAARLRKKGRLPGARTYRSPKERRAAEDAEEERVKAYWVGRYCAKAGGG